MHRFQARSARNEYDSHSSTRIACAANSAPYNVFTEVVLCVLLDKFKFAPANGKEIEWKMAVLVTPAVVGELGVTQLPLEVSLAD